MLKFSQKKMKIYLLAPNLFQNFLDNFSRAVALMQASQAFHEQVLLIMRYINGVNFLSN